MGLKQSGLVVLLMVPMIYANAVTVNNATTVCPYEANPFYLDSFEVEAEKDSKGLSAEPKEVLVLEWVYREHVGCQINHNDELKKKIHLACSTYRCNISDNCYNFLISRINSIKEIVKHNLIMLLKTKAIRLFNGIPFKQVVFKDKSITDLPEGEFLQIVNATMYKLAMGFTVPNNMEKVPSKDFDEIFGEGVRLHDEIDKAFFVFSELPGSYNRPKCTKEDKDKCNDINIERLYKIIVGDEDDVGPSGKINFGYVRLRRLLEQGVRFVMKNLGKKDEDIKSLELPLVPPCFQS